MWANLCTKLAKAMPLVLHHESPAESLLARFFSRLTASAVGPSQPSHWLRLRYKRADGVDLTATLYLPPGYDQAKDGPLPCLLWAYPREFKSKVGTAAAFHPGPQTCCLLCGAAVWWRRPASRASV